MCAYYSGKKMNKHGKIKYFTSWVNGHKHTWKRGNKRTSVDAGHSHPINFSRKMAEKGRTDHTHKLLRGKY